MQELDVGGTGGDTQRPGPPGDGEDGRAGAQPGPAMTSGGSTRSPAAADSRK